MSSNFGGAIKIPKIYYNLLHCLLASILSEYSLFQCQKPPYSDTEQLLISQYSINNQ